METTHSRDETKSDSSAVAKTHPARHRRSRALLVTSLVVAAVLVGACQPVQQRSKGTTVGANPVSNPMYVGQCTWGAEEQWHQATGSYLAVSGDAWQWAGTAAAFGWTVTSTPSSRSIVVFPRGVAGAHTDTGHVAWVTAVTQRADGAYLDVVEMSWTYGRYNWDMRTLKADPAFAYILAP